MMNPSEKNEMEMNLQTLHVQRKIWKGHNKNATCWAFCCMNDDKKIDLGNLQVMRCLLCYNSLMHVNNLNTKERKWLITYYKTYGIIVLKKHADSDHAIIIKKNWGINKCFNQRTIWKTIDKNKIKFRKCNI
jgi:hypothetical protein